MNDSFPELFIDMPKYLVRCATSTEEAHALVKACQKLGGEVTSECFETYDGDLSYMVRAIIPASARQ